mgnify:FL=1
MIWNESLKNTNPYKRLYADETDIKRPFVIIHKGPFACINHSVPMAFSNARCTPRYTALANVSPNRE